MREIKFRAWDSEKEEMAKVVSLGEEDITLQDSKGRIWDSVTDYIAYPMQYTGLKDKNGVEIYEGDIIRSDKDSPIGTVVTAKVYWKGAGFALLTTRGSDTTSAYLELLNPFCEVIGNIYEKPELLEGNA